MYVAMKMNEHSSKICTTPSVLGVVCPQKWALSRPLWQPARPRKPCLGMKSGLEQALNFKAIDPSQNAISQAIMRYRAARLHCLVRKRCFTTSLLRFGEIRPLEELPARIHPNYHRGKETDYPCIAANVNVSRASK